MIKKNFNLFLPILLGSTLLSGAANAFSSVMGYGTFRSEKISDDVNCFFLSLLVKIHSQPKMRFADGENILDDVLTGS